MYKNILIPLENSATDRAILDHIRPLAKAMGSRLMLVHVADGYAARNQKHLNLADSEEMRTDRAYLETCRRELEAEGFSVSTILECGEPAPKIVELVERERCDLIAMATHGHRFVMDLLLGSVAENVRHRTQVPVLLVRAQKA